MLADLQKRIKDFYKHSADVLGRIIWHPKHIGDKTPQGQFYALLRTLAITFNGLTNNNIFVRAAALSYYSLIALGPLVAIVVLSSSFVLASSSNENLAVDFINRVLISIAPTAKEYQNLEMRENGGRLQEVPPGGRENPPSIDAGPDGELTPTELVEEVMEEDPVRMLIRNFIMSAQSGTVGLVGTVVLIMIVIQLLVSVETTLNEIWGVRQGRKMTQRVFFYWGFITLSAALSFASFSLLSTATIVGVLQDVPFGVELAAVITFFGPVFAFFITILLLSCFYRFFPNTHVNWSAALIGASLATALLFLNYFLSFLYVSRVVSNRSLYGSMGIFPVLMIGLYIFWLFILLGGQITYAAQNADFLTKRQAWNNISDASRRILCFAVFTIICRRFQDCLPPQSSSEISSRLRVPNQIINECLNRLEDLGWIYSISSTDEHGEILLSYAPAKPLSKVSLHDLVNTLETYGNNEGIEFIEEIDPLIEYFQEHAVVADGTEEFDRSMEELLNALPRPITAPESAKEVFQKKGHESLSEAGDELKV